MMDKSDVTEGLNNFLFLTGGSNHVLRYYVDETYFGPGMRTAWQELLLERTDRANELGIKYFHLAPPEKLTVYQDQYPAPLPYPHGAPSAALTASFAGHPREATLRNAFVDVLPFFAQQKAVGVALYWKTDTHWTFEGAYSAYQLLCHRMGTEQVAAVLAVPDTSSELILDLGGKLSPPRTELIRFKQLPLNARRTDANELVRYKEVNGLEGEVGLHIGSRVVFSNEQAPDPRKIVVFGDSFSEYRPHLLTGILAETFAETHFLWASQIDWGYVNRVKPDFLITELAERFMTHVPTGDVDVDALAAEKVSTFKAQSTHSVSPLQSGQRIAVASDSLIGLDDLLLLESSGAVRLGGTIQAAEGCTGFITYGPYQQVPGGLYQVRMRLGRPSGKPGRLTLDVFSSGSIIAKADFLNIDQGVDFIFLAPSDNLIELRIKSHIAAVTVTEVSLTPAAMSCLGKARPIWSSCIGDQVLKQIILPDTDATDLLLSPMRAVELLFEGETMLKVALPDLASFHDELARRGVDSILARAMFEDVGFSDWSGSEAAVPSLVAFPAVRHTFQSQILQESRLSAISPVTRSSMDAQSSVPIVAGDHLPVAYEFLSGDAPMVAIANAGWGGGLSFLWLVRQDVLLIDDRNWCIGFDGPSLIAQYLQICVQYRDRLPAYRASNKTSAAVSGYQPNLGHFYWNDVSGLEREMRLGRLKHVERIYQRPALWSDVAELFPEVADRVRAVEAPQLLSTIIDERRLVVRLTASAIDADLSERVRASATQVLQAQNVIRFTAVEELVSSGDSFKLFLNIRSHNKAWNEQIEGLSQVISLAIARFSQVLVYLDGMPDCKEVSEALKLLFEGRCIIVDGLSSSFSETLLWCFGCDAYVAVIGSGLVPLTWLADRPGVAHSNKGHHNQIDGFWTRIRASNQPLLTPTLDQIKDDGPGIYTNYSIDPAVLTGLFAQLLDQMAAAAPLAASAREC